MGMANLPDLKTDSSPSSTLNPTLEKLTDLIATGITPGEAARKLAKGDKKKAQRYRALFRNHMYRADVQDAIKRKAEAEVIGGLGVAVQGAIKRARRGRMDAVKWIGEATGFHNPKVQHEHSGDVSIHINIPRPEREEQPAIEAEVVEEED